MKEVLLPGRIIKWIFIAAVIVLLSLSAFLYVNISSLLNSYKQVNHSYLIYLKLEKIILELKDAENAQRGFLLTNDSIYLHPEHEARKGTAVLFTELRSLISDSHQLKSLNELQVLVEERLRRLDSSRRQFLSNINQERKNDAILHGKIIMDKIRLLTNKLEQQQSDVLLQVMSRLNRNAYFTPALAMALIITTLLILSATFYNLYRQLFISHRFQKTLEGTNRDLEQKKNELERSNDELESFNYIATHDLKEPVRKIKTFAHMILDTDFDKLSEKNQRNLHRLLSATGRMQLLLKDLMTYTTINTEKKNFLPVDLNAVMAQVTENLKDAIEESRASIHLQSLPTIKGISFLLVQLFENLLANTLKFRKQNETLVIEIFGSQVSQQDEGNDFLPAGIQYCKILLRDNGMGFDSSYADKIFDLFFRLQNHDLPGTGIGLTICKKIIHIHNGFIRAISAPGKGTTFEMYFPCY